MRESPRAIEGTCPLGTQCMLGCVSCDCPCFLLVCKSILARGRRVPANNLVDGPKDGVALARADLGWFVAGCGDDPPLPDALHKS